MRRPFSIALIASASMLPLAAPALAQEDEEIVVTAQKREELLREIPQSVTAVTSETLDRLQANSFEEYAGRVPGLVVTGDNRPDDNRVVLRGLNNEGIGANVAVYVDETPYGSSSGLAEGSVLAYNMDPFDIARVEVLRGPQGTLYGANSMAGLIRFVTRDPSSDGFELRTRSTVETTENGDESWAVRAAANIPLGDRAALRISGVKRETGGYIDAFNDANADGDLDAGETVFEDYNSSETTGARATFLLQATDALSIRLSAQIQDSISRGRNQVTYNVPGAGVGEFAVAGPTFGDLLVTDANINVFADAANRIYNGTVDWDFGWASLVSSTSFGELDQLQFNFVDAFVPGGLNLGDGNLQEKFTQEFRLVSPSNEEGLEWIVGLFYTDERAAFSQDIAAVDPLFGTAFLEIGSQYQEIAAYGTATYHFSPQFDISAGLRFAQNEQELDQCATGTGPLTVVVAPILGCFLGESDEDVTTYSISPRWRLSDDTMLYARLATGYRPGGPNVAVVGLPASYESDTTVSYEVGVKTDFMDNLLRLDAAAFYNSWDDMQVGVSDPTDTFQGNDNAETALSQGVEWALTYTPTDNLTIGWNGAYTDAHLTADSPNLNGLDGDSLPYVPGISTSLDVDFEWVAFGDTEAYLGAGVRYVGEQRGSWRGGAVAPNWRQIKLDPYTVVDLRGGLEFANGIGLDLFARNVTDERGPSRAGSGQPTTNASVLRPRTVGLTLTTAF